MLPRRHRLTRPDDFRRTVRSGIKSAAPSVIAYGLMVEGSSSGSADAPARVGITVNKAVGGSVVRHRVARRIRHIVSAELAGLPRGSTWVIRALPYAGTPAGDAQLGEHVQQAIARVLEARR